MERQVRRIVRYIKENKVEEELLSCYLIDGQGMELDKHADGSDQQLSVIGSCGRAWIQQQERKGFCFKKCKENLCLEGSLQNLTIGSRIVVGDAIIEITSNEKSCYPDLCELKEKDIQTKCLLQQEFRFAKVIKSGQVISFNHIIWYSNVTIGNGEKNGINTY